MCRIFIGADPASYESRTRSVRLHGVVTSLRLENLHWQVLEEIAGRDGLTVAQLIETLYDELVADRGAVGNFSSFLRVCALRYENLIAQGLIPRDAAIPIRSRDAEQVLRGQPPTPRSPHTPHTPHTPRTVPQPAAAGPARRALN
ncbi:MAG: ribbon-helix-helix domain-containing protein [Rubrivivax sp.]|nr:ribbon-helix-helix domain-containing protein [Rubrivivax sp.]